jgi:SAM-dependent methyltransferase
MWIPYVLPASWPIAVLVAFLLASYAVIAIAVHGRLALDRPDEAHLTGFYLVVSLGGLLATAFVALVAPIVFDAVYEYPVLLVAGLCVMAVMPGPGDARRSGPVAMIVGAGLRLAPYLAAGVALALVGGLDQPRVAAAILLIAAIGAAIIALSITPRVLAIGTTAAIVTLVILGSTHPLLRVRTFFGVVEVREGYDGLAHTEFSGTTLHGLQFLDARRSEPTTYYVRSGPLGGVMDDLSARLPDGGSIGVVGLGVGTVAAYERPADSMTFFEIDPAVIDIARDPRDFTYLADAPNPPAVVLGDARLSLAAQPDSSYDLVVLDAFSSDAVPAHLLTREAISTYMRTLRPGGIVAFHLSNRFYDLAPAVASTARSLGLGAAQWDYGPSDASIEGLAARPTTWVVVGRPDDTARFTRSGWSDPTDGPVLTDDFSDIVRLLRIR